MHDTVIRPSRPSQGSGYRYDHTNYPKVDLGLFKQLSILDSFILGRKKVLLQSLNVYCVNIYT